MTYIVQLAEIGDAYWIAETAAVRMLTEELKRPELVNIDNLHALTHKGLIDGTIWICKKNGNNIGALGAILVPNLFNPTIRTFAEIFWWVDPSERNGRAGLLLMNAFDKKASEIADESTMSLLSSSEVNIETMGRKGFMLGEFGFRKEYQ